MQLGILISVTGLKTDSFIDGAEKARRMGYEFVELGACDATGQAPVADLGQMSADEAAAIVDAIRERELGISAIQAHASYLSPDEAVAEMNIEHAERVLSLAASIGVNFVHTVTGLVPPGTTEKQAMQRLAATYDRLLDAAQRENVALGIEPVFEYAVGNLRTMQALDAELDRDDLLVNFDPSHFPYHEEDPVPFIYKYADRIRHCHAKDATVEEFEGDLEQYAFETPTGKQFKFAAPGTGVLDWPAIMDALDNIGYDGVMSLELGHGIPNEEAAAARNVEFFRTLFQ